MFRRVFNRYTPELLSSVGDIAYTSHYRLDIRYGPENLWASLSSCFQGSETRLRPLVVTFLPFLDVGERDWAWWIEWKKRSGRKERRGGLLPPFAW